ncbi:Protein-tyrosine phosphatase [Oesophagostomum dentatum]|uniref:Protein-tyrosine phosphatase n=1 Tax=Oesophagostomum dentatum TaxID=61180 RepID=A0A0B1T523_OESDE|nr:Protein-tyrosine phosphatase [Oesophagostomum dentatum]
MAEVQPPAAVSRSEEDERSALSQGESTVECSSCHVSILSSADPNTSRFKLKPGENLYDFEGSTASTQSLSSFLHVISASNVYRMFFAYTQVLQHDTHRCCTSYNRYGNQNRFSDIPCIEETRVHVKHPQEDHDYIHANWIDGYREPKKFILTQAPLSHTFQQFWTMIWQEKSVIVVSMIQMFDVNGAEWSISYIPKKTGEVRQYGDIKLVHCGTRCIRQTYDATILKVIRNGSERRLLHICYFAWGHRGSPRKPTEFLNFIADINYNRELLVQEAVKAGWLKANENSPIVIHCLTGVSRSATVVALDICLRKLDDTAKRPCGPMADVEDVVLRIRTQRAMAMQKPEQYLFLHLALFEYAVRQRYITDETYAELDLEGFFYEPHQHSEAEASEPSAPVTKASTPVKEKKSEKQNPPSGKK